MCLRQKMKGKSQILSYGFRLRDSEAEQRVLQFLHVCCLNVRSHSSVPESKRQNPPDINIDLPFFFRYGHITSLSNVPSPAPSESLPY